MLMGLSFFQHALDSARKMAGPHRRLEHTIQTNGTLLNDDWGSFLRKNDFLVGISIDGPETLHNTYRKDAKGGPTFNRVHHGLEILRKHAVRFNVMCSVNSSNSHRPRELYRFLRDQCGSDFIQFIPVVVPLDDERVSSQSVSSRQWGNFLIEVFDEWFRNDVGKVFVQIFESALAAWLGLPNPMCIFADRCGASLALEHNGDLFSCDHFVDPNHLLGNIMSDDLASLMHSSAQEEFGNRKKASLSQKCLRCEVLFACHGDCPKNRFLRTSASESISYLCEGYSKFFVSADGPLKMLAQLVSSGHSAGELYRMLKKMRPETPCPCGSGLRLELCHAHGNSMA